MSNSKKMNFIYIALAMIFLLCLALSLAFSNQSLQTSTRSLNDDAQELAESTLSGSFDIRVISRENQNIALENSASYSGGTAYRVDWSDAQEIVVSFAADAENPPTTDPENPVYTLSVSVNYLQGYISSNNFDVDDRISLENIDGAGSSDLTALSSFSYTLNLDEGITGTYAGNEVTISGWGIYQFVIDINGQEAYSNYYAIEPSFSIAAAPEIAYNVVSSDNSMHDSFQFYLENFDDYAYIDEACLVWYVRGEGDDGTTYALCSSDLALANFSECSTSLYDSYERTGQTFLFNDNEISGKWEVWCEYRFNNATYSVSSNVETVETGDSFDYFIIIYIVIALAVLALIVVIVTSVVKNKKEKVW